MAPPVALAPLAKVEMDFLAPSNLQAITGGRWLTEPGENSLEIKGFSFDTRSLEPGDLFLAIRSDTSDGHAYVEQAMSKGAAMVIVDREARGQRSEDRSQRSGVRGQEEATENLKFQILNLKSIPVLLVPDTVLALQQIAAAWRTVLGAHGVKVIAVTGSNGKTTTRNMIHCALSAALRGTQSIKSFNNHLGVPLTLLSARAEDDFVVAEVGTNHPGEIATLAAIVKPHIAIITNIGTAHIGMFGSKDAIAVEKSSLFRFIEHGGYAIMRSSEKYAAQWQREVVPSHASTLTFDESADVHLTGPAHSDEQGLHFTMGDSVEVEVDLPMLGEHNIENALAAMAVAQAMGVDDQVAATALSKLTGVEMRMQIIRLGSSTKDENTSDKSSAAITVINDAYNANPDSMAAGLAALASLPVPSQARRIAILGDMRELGDETIPAHRSIAAMILEMHATGNNSADKGDAKEKSSDQPKNNIEKDIDMAILIGEQMEHAALVLASGGQSEDFITHYPRWSDDLPEKVAALLQEGDVVLLKASRGMQLERLIPAMERKFGAVH